MSTPFQQPNQFRPVTAKLLGRLVAPLLDTGVVTTWEYDQLITAMRSLSKNSSSEQPPLKLITGQEAAEMLGISFSQFRALESEGQFPFVRKTVGKSVRYRNTDILRFISAED